MKRRDFIRNSATALSVPLIFQGHAMQVFGNNFKLKSILNGNSNRKLIIIQLHGGNDGLNMFFPITQYQNLQQARPDMIIPRSKLLQLTDALLIHPSMINFKRLYDARKALVIQNVGYPEMNRSHIRSRNIIDSGSAADEILTTGWMGRYFDTQYPGYPENYPNENNPHPIAISFGANNSLITQGIDYNFGAVLENISADYSSPAVGSSSFPDTPYGHELKFISETIAATDAYQETISSAANNAENLSALYPQTSNPLASQLKMVARLIGGGLNTQLYILNLGGFDTHANQVTSSASPETGTHAELLKQLSDAIRAFQDDLELMNKDEEVIGLVYSEFGRRIKANDQLGTDHGTASPAILFGTLINPLTMGKVPQIPDVVGNDDNIEIEFDIRSVVASVFSEWFETNESSVNQLLSDEFGILPILKTSQGSPFFANSNMKVIMYPVPAIDYIAFDIFNEDKDLKIRLFNEVGQHVFTFMDEQVEGNHQEITFPVDAFPRGNYIITVQSEKDYYSQKIIFKD